MNVSLFLKLLLFSPALLLVKLLRPFILVRFGKLKNSHLGFFASETTIYILERQATKQTRVLDCLGLEPTSANEQLTKMWSRELFLSSLANPMSELVAVLPTFSDHRVPWRDEQYFDIHGLISENLPVLKFTSEELEQGRRELKRFGVPDGAKFVCLCVRDSSYDLRRSGSELALSNQYRDSDIHDYLPAIDYLISQDVYVLRMGAVVETPLEVDSEKFIDYASSYRTPFMDIFLCGNCEFYFGDGAGLVNVARIFKRPIAMTNWIPIGLMNTAQPNDVIIHKRLSQQNRELTLSEQLSSKANDYCDTRQYRDAELKVLNNSSDEILECVEEMWLKLSGQWVEPEDCHRLQERYWALMPEGLLREPIRANIGYHFLKRYL